MCYRWRSLLWKAWMFLRWYTMVWDCGKANPQVTLGSRKDRHSLPSIHKRKTYWLSSKNYWGLNISKSHTKRVNKHRLQLCSYKVLEMAKPPLYSRDSIFQLLGRVSGAEFSFSSSPHKSALPHAFCRATEKYWESVHFQNRCVVFSPQIRWKHIRIKVLAATRYVSKLALNGDTDLKP